MEGGEPAGLDGKRLIGDYLNFLFVRKIAGAAPALLLMVVTSLLDDLFGPLYCHWPQLVVIRLRSDLDPEALPCRFVSQHLECLCFWP